MDSVMLYVAAENERWSRNAKAKRRLIRDSNDLMKMSDYAFEKTFRLNKEAFSYVFREIKDELEPIVRTDSISPVIKLAACLKFFAEGSYQNAVGSDLNIGIAQSTFSLILTEMLNIMEKKLCERWISLQMSEEEIEEAKSFFMDNSGFPNIVMCIDGTHIKILQPVENKHLFLNRKGFYSLNALVICDHKMRIRAVNANFQGANHDAHIWNISKFRAYFEDCYNKGIHRNTWILGDATYHLEPWLMTPLRAPTAGTAGSRYNEKHAKCRNIVERTFGVLKNRFRCLLAARALHYRPEKASQIVHVCSALHNICLHYKISNEEFENVVINNIDNENLHATQNSTSAYFNEACAIRDQIVNIF